MIEVDLDSPLPIYLQLARVFQRRIEIGALKPGERLPTVRDLAVQARVNRNTAAKAIQHLEAEGWVRTHVGRGTFVDERPRLDDRTARVDAILRRWLDEAHELGIDVDEAIERLRVLAARRDGGNSDG